MVTEITLWGKVFNIDPIAIVALLLAGFSFFQGLWKNRLAFKGRLTIGSRTPEGKLIYQNRKDAIFVQPESQKLVMIIGTCKGRRLYITGASFLLSDGQELSLPDPERAIPAIPCWIEKDQRIIIPFGFDGLVKILREIRQDERKDITIKHTLVWHSSGSCKIKGFPQYWEKEFNSYLKSEPQPKELEQ
ncbi:MAG: hypothetical protein JXB38_17675 [Anaerolineales bacterium]|nr:hypothetical protein [Anaerolineales bacterium]